MFFFCLSRLLMPGGRVECDISWLTQEEHFTAVCLCCSVLLTLSPAPVGSSLGAAELLENPAPVWAVPMSHCYGEQSTVGAEVRWKRP